MPSPQRFNYSFRGLILGTLRKQVFIGHLHIYPQSPDKKLKVISIGEDLDKRSDRIVTETRSPFRSGTLLKRFQMNGLLAYPAVEIKL
jgi:hypothetical protein